MKVKDHANMERCDQVPGVIKIKDQQGFDAAKSARDRAMQREQRIERLEEAVAILLEEKASGG